MSYTYNPIYTHFKGNDISRSELIQRMVVQTIIKSKLSDKERSWSKVFELKHSSSVIQIGRILGQKRGLKIDLIEVICALHDIYVNSTGRVTDHARKGAPIAKKMLEKTKMFSKEEIKIIVQAVRNHSDKHVFNKNKYDELIKDADVFDCGLYEGVHDAYVFEKSPSICRTYFDRIIKVRKELGLPYDKRWEKVELIEQGKKYYEQRKK